MKHAKWISVLMLLFVPLIAAAQMQPTERIVTQVPFKFMVGNVAMPSGECTIQLADEKGWVLVIRNPEAKVSVFTLAVSGLDKKVARDSAMVFHRYGDRYFLAGVKIGDSPQVYTFKQSKLEKEWTALNGPGSEEVVASLR
jgi:hypothetical protein